MISAMKYILFFLLLTQLLKSQVVESRPEVGLAWNYGETPEEPLGIDGFIVYMGKTGERDPVANPYPLTFMVLLPHTVANPPSYGTPPPVTWIAEPKEMTTNTFSVDIGVMPRGEYYSVVTAFRWNEDGSLKEGPPSNEIGFFLYTVSVTESEDGINWNLSFSESFMDMFKVDPTGIPLQKVVGRKFFQVQFKEDKRPALPSTKSEPRKLIIPTVQ